MQRRRKEKYFSWFLSASNAVYTSFTLEHRQWLAGSVRFDLLLSPDRFAEIKLLEYGPRSIFLALYIILIIRFTGMRNETLGDELLDREKGGRKSKEFAFRKGTKASTEFVFIPSLKHIRRPTKDFVTKIKSNSHAHVSMATNWVNSLRIFPFFFFSPVSRSFTSLFLVLYFSPIPPGQSYHSITEDLICEGTWEIFMNAYNGFDF